MQCLLQRDGAVTFPIQFPPAFWSFRLALRPASSTFAVAFWLVRIDRQLDGRALFPRNHRPVAFPTPPPLPRLCAEVTAQQKQEDTERGDADDQKNWISYVEHSQNFNRYCAESCTFKPDGKSGPAPTGCTVYRYLMRQLVGVAAVWHNNAQRLWGKSRSMNRI